MKKPLIKKSLISLITLFAVVLLTILSCIIFGTIQPKNNGATNIKLLNSGKMDIVMSVPMSEIPDEAKDNVEGYISTYLSAVSSQSGDNDFFKIRKVEEKDGAYEVRVSTRRMDKIKGLGLLDYGEGKAFSALSGKLKLIQEYSQGTIREQFTKVYPSITGESVQAFIQLKKGEVKTLYVTDVTEMEQLVREAGVEPKILDIPRDNWFLTYVLPILLGIILLFLS